jgi:hypothetical protein
MCCFRERHYDETLLSLSHIRTWAYLTSKQSAHSRLACCRKVHPAQFQETLTRCATNSSSTYSTKPMINEKSRFEKRHVLYCDLLGFSRYSLSRFFETSRCFRLFSQLDRMVTEASTEIDPSIPDPLSGLPPDYVVKPEAIYGSDSIVISTPATNIDAIWLCAAAAKIQNHVCSHGFLLRGSIVTGDLYHSGNTIFGPAIAKAVELEKSGSAPVIVVTNETLEYFTRAESDDDKEIVKHRLYQLIAREEDSRPYIDPFSLTKIHTNQQTINRSTRINIDCWRTLIERGLRCRKPKIREKYLWTAERFNRCLCNKASAIEPIPIGWRVRLTNRLSVTGRKLRSFLVRLLP